MKQLDANTLVAYVDGELDIEAAGQVEARLADDPEACRIAEQLRESAALVRAAHAHVAHEAVPERLVDVIELSSVSDDLGGEIVPSHLVNMILSAPDDEGETVGPALVKAANETASAQTISAARRRSVAGVAAVAVFAAVMVGSGMMLQKFQSGIVQPGLSHQATAVSAMEDPWREAAFQQALETKKSETAVIWENPENGRSGAIMPVKTYRRDDGTFCRAFRTLDTGNTVGKPNYGVACREPGEKGRWVKAVEAISAPGQGAKLQF